MSLEIRFAWNTEGRPTAVSPPPVEAVGAFFEREVGPEAGSLGEWILEAINDVLAGRETGAPQVSSGQSGSSVTVDSSEGGFVEVVCALDESDGPFREVRRDGSGRYLCCELPIRGFRAALVGWLAFIRGEAGTSESGAAPVYGGS